MALLALPALLAAAPAPPLAREPDSAGSRQ